MSKAIPPIRPNPRHGKEVATEAAVAWGGAQPKPKPTSAPTDQVPTNKRRSPAATKQPGRRGRPRRTEPELPQQSVRITDLAGLIKMAKHKGVNRTALINLVLAEKKEEWGL